MMPSFRQIAVFLIIVCAHAGADAKNVHYVTYGNEQGLPSNLTKAIIQDAMGFIWIGSDAGLVRFDGKTFVTYNDQLPSPYVKQLFLDRSKRLLIVTDLGIAEAHVQGTVHHFSTLLAATPQHTDSTLFYPKGLYASTDGSLWISEPDAVVHYVNGTLHRYPFAEKYRADSYVRSFQFIEDKDGKLFVLSERGFLFQYNRRDDVFELFANEQDAKPYTIEAALFDSAGAIIIGGNRGIFELHAHTGTKSYSLSQIASLSGVSSLICGKDGALFAGTWLKGIHRVERHNGACSVAPTTLPLRVINALANGRDGEIWVSSDEGIALVADTYFTDVPLPFTNFYIEAITRGPNGSIFATDGQSVIAVTEKNGTTAAKTIFTRTESLILSLAADGTTVWIGFRDGFLMKVSEGRAEKIIIPSGGNRLLDHLFVDAKHDLWICQDGLNGIYKLSPDHHFTLYGASKGITSHISVVKEVAPGTILCGGAGSSSYLFQYDEGTDVFVNKSLPVPGAPAALAVNDMLMDRTGRVWLAASNGLLMYSKGSVARPPGYDLYSGEPVKSIAEDSLGNIWLGTDRGVLRYANDQVSRFDGRDGLTSMTMAYRACIVDDAQRVWLGTAHGISRWNVGRMKAGKTPTPLVLSLMENGVATANAASGTDGFAYNSYISAVVASLTYPADRIEYRCRVKELSDEWSQPSSSSTLMISQLHEGRYTLEICAQQPGHLWSDPSAITFTVAPPFYRTWWMYTLYVIFIGIGIAAVIKFRIEAAAREKLRAALFESETNLRALFNTMHDIYFQSDKNGRIVDVAPSIVLHSGYAREELIGRDTGIMYYHPADRKVLVAALMRSGEIIDHEILLRRKTGEPVWVSMNVQVVKNEKGEVIGSRGVMHEITSRKKLEDDLRENLKRERELNELKSRFVSMVSHEFRTPLASILSSTELLERYGKSWDEHKAEKARTHYARITEAIKRMVLLLDDVLLLGKAEAGRLEFSPKPMDIVLFCRQIVEELQSTLAAHHQGINFLPSIGIDAALFDAKLLRQVVTNILSNALKYSPEGGAVTFRLYEEDTNVVFSVSDKGIGIPENELAHLFESFHRSTNVGSIPGTGLGLVIVKQCVELHGGRITVASAEGQGSTFTITLPLVYEHKGEDVTA